MLLDRDSGHGRKGERDGVREYSVSAAAQTSDCACVCVCGSINFILNEISLKNEIIFAACASFAAHAHMLCVGVAAAQITRTLDICDMSFKCYLL